MIACSAASELLAKRIAEGDFPSAVYLVAERGQAAFADAIGDAVRVPERAAARIDTIYDLASLTKVLVTGLLLAKLVEDGRISLADPVTKHFPEFIGTDKSEVTVGQLVTHTSGFKAWLPFYLVAPAEQGERSRRVFERIVAEPLENPPGTKVVYSDLNFILLGQLVEKSFAEPIAKVVEDVVVRPLGLRDTCFNPPADSLSRIAASEDGNAHERKTCVDSGYEADSYRWRSGVIRGEVHDGNCFYLGGASGHAGLFGSADDVLEIAKQFLPATTRILKPETCALFRRNMTEGLNESRSLAFQLASTPDSTASASLSPESFGHLGFTGTSLWIDPVSERIFILLTNRTHDHGLPFVNINQVRRTFNETANSALERL